ncbi:MAG: efflux transporter periplasmic adaptor subunit, partial [Rubrivivax sp.]|nr:efflux transporter periplasmic adaptor subunit [Rubrivivax sp.]
MKKIHTLVAVTGIVVAAGAAWWWQNGKSPSVAVGTAPLPAGGGAPAGVRGPGGPGGPGGPAVVEVAKVQLVRLTDEVSAVG